MSSVLVLTEGRGRDRDDDYKAVTTTRRAVGTDLLPAAADGHVPRADSCTWSSREPAVG